MACTPPPVDRFCLPLVGSMGRMALTMRISLLLMAAVVCSMLAGCGSVNGPQAAQKRTLNRTDPLMNTHYLSSRAQR